MKKSLQVYIQGTEEAVPFYQKAFGATLGYNVKNPDGTYMHAELKVNGTQLLALSESGSSNGTENMKRSSPSDYWWTGSECSGISTYKPNSCPKLGGYFS